MLAKTRSLGAKHARLPAAKTCMDLYIAFRSDAPHLLKAGMSSHALSRCRQLQTGHCFQIRVLAIFKGMGACEKPAHRALREYRVDWSEWFAVDMLTAVEAIQEAQPQNHLQGQRVA